MRKLSGYLIVVFVVLFFFLSSEEDSIPLLDWVNDPRGSSERNKQLVAYDRAIAEGVEPDLPTPPEVTDTPPAELQEQALESLLASVSTGVRGTVKDIDGAPVPGIVLSIEESPLATPPTAADKDGKFAFDVSDFEGLLAIDTTFFVLLGGELSLSELGPQSHELVVAPRIDFSGTVLDAEGQPLAGAEVYGYAALAAAASSELSVVLPDRLEVFSSSDSQGRYVLQGLPHFTHSAIEVRLEGYELLRRDIPDVADYELELRLVELPPDEDLGLDQESSSPAGGAPAQQGDGDQPPVPDAPADDPADAPPEQPPEQPPGGGGGGGQR